MIKKVFYALLFVLSIMIIIVLFNTFRSKADISIQQAISVEKISDSAIMHLSKAIQIKTVSYSDTLPIDTAEFEKFKLFLEVSYPTVHQKLPRQLFSKYSYMYTWKGQDTTLKPIVLMAHMDVVPVEREVEHKWSYPSFSGKIVSDTIWGRGSIDDKSSVIAIMEAAEQLLKENIQPKQTIYLCFGHDEEISGKRGAAKMAEWFKTHGIRPQLVLDEGGQVDTEHFKDVKRPVALLGVGEKGYVSIDLTVEIPGGHSSMPKAETAIDILNKAIENVRSQQMEPVITEPVNELLNRIGSQSSFVNKMALSNMWLFKKLLIKKFEKNNGTNAMIHTTLVPTIIKAGVKDNVVPSYAMATFNSRILPGQTSEDVIKHIQKMVNDDRIKVKKHAQFSTEPSSLTPYTSPGFKKVEEVAYQTIPNVMTTPFLMLGATDSRYFRTFSEATINFTPYRDVKGFHGINERIPVSDFRDMVFFYKLLMKAE